jgi:hypothetical protein
MLVKLASGGYHVFGPLPSTWTPSRGAVISTHNSAEAAIEARKRQEAKK